MISFISYSNFTYNQFLTFYIEEYEPIEELVRMGNGEFCEEDSDGDDFEVEEDVNEEDGGMSSGEDTVEELRLAHAIWMNILEDEDEEDNVVSDDD